MQSLDHRRLSFGGKSSELVEVAAWTFDVQLANQTQVTSSVRHSDRGDALGALFGAQPGAKVFGTGMPLTESAAEFELIRSQFDRVIMIDDVANHAG